MIPIMTIDFSPKTAQDNDIKYDDWFLAKNCPRYWYQIWRMIFRQKCPRSWYQIWRMIEKLYIVAKTSGLPNGEVLTHLRRRSSVLSVDCTFNLGIPNQESSKIGTNPYKNFSGKLLLKRTDSKFLNLQGSKKSRKYPYKISQKWVQKSQKYPYKISQKWVQTSSNL